MIDNIVKYFDECNVEHEILQESLPNCLSLNDCGVCHINNCGFRKIKFHNRTMEQLCDEEKRVCRVEVVDRNVRELSC